ncbi:MAG: hypothetical protein ACRDPE_15750 [Solirubrobacterales bacterium]
MEEILLIGFLVGLAIVLIAFAYMTLGLGYVTVAQKWEEWRRSR